MTMPATQLNLKEEDVIKVALEFLYNRDLHISQVALERETGIINGNHSDDILFLRQLIIDGQWDDCLEFIQPLQVLEAFNVNKVKFLILRQKYVELLFVRSEAGQNVVKGTVDEVVKVLNQLENFATKEEHSNLCLLLTLPRLNDHLAFKDWNPAKSRMKCFSEVYPLIENFLPADKKTITDVKYSRNDRLMQIIIKGLLYESCVSYCRAKATGSKDCHSIDINFPHLLDGAGFSDSDLSLLSWLQSIPSETFSVPFEQRTLNVDVERLERPSLETSWTEHMLVRPIKPKMFPHSAISFSRPHSATDLMTRSLMPVPAMNAPSQLPITMALSTGNISPMIGCEPGFHLSRENNKLMVTSVDRLFKSDEMFLSSAFMDHKHLPQILENTPGSGGITPDKVMQSIIAPVENIVKTDDTSIIQPFKGIKINEKTEVHTNKQVDRGNILYREFQSRKNNVMMSSDILDDKIGVSSSVIPQPEDGQDNTTISDQMNSHHPNQTPILDNGDRNFRSMRMPDSINNKDLLHDMANRSRGPRAAHLLLALRLTCESVAFTVRSSDGHSNTKSQLIMSANDASVKRLEELFTGLGRDRVPNPRRPSVVVVERKVDSACDVHGRRASLGREHHFHRSSVSTLPTVKRRDSMPPMALASPRRRDSLALPTSPPMKEMEHPSAFPNFLRRDDSTLSRKESRANRNSIASFPSLRRDSVASNYSTYNPPTGGLRDWNRDSIGSVSCLLRRMSGVNRRFSIDSLDSRRSSWDPGRRASGVSVTWEDYKDASSKGKPVGKQNENDSTARPRFIAVTALEDVQAVRCAEFHPAGNVYAVGSNSRTLRICTYPDTSHLREDHKTYQPTVVFKRTKHHKGSLYCIAWSPAGDLLATGSNDKTVKLMRFNSDTTNLEGQEVELTMHDGTVRDLCFIEDSTNQSSLLISAGAGDCKIYVTDCATGSPFQALSGHSGNVLSLYNWGGALFVSGSQDKSVRFWDLRTGGCINVVNPTSGPATRSSPVSSLSVEPSGRLLVSGHEDGTCSLYDIRGGRTIKSFQPHSQDVRSVRFSPAAYYLLTAGYDSKLVLTDLQGDLTALLPSVVVATHTDKVISGRWHPKDFTFLSTSADKTAVLWALPPA